MPKHPEKPTPRPKEPSRRASPGAKKGASSVRKLAQSTLLAAGIAAGYMGLPEFDSRFHLFDPTLVDRLECPITRHHE